MTHELEQQARVFYSRVIWTALVNAYAVRAGLFDELLCESEDPAIATRWRNELPLIRQRLLAKVQQDEAE